MALAASELKIVDPVMEPSGVKLKLAKLAFDSSYPTGGEAITVSELECNRVIGVVPIADISTYTLSLDVANQKVKVIAGAGTEVANATDLSALTPTCLIVCV